MKKKVYLAGGMHSRWQDKVIKEIDTLEFFDPSHKGGVIYNPDEGDQMTFEEYTAWDLLKIDESDIVLVYSESDNPGVGYICEAGYAKGKGKFVVFVQQEGNKHIEDRYIKFIECVSDVVYSNLDDAIKFLKTL